ncbi:MAG: DUF502 domain-containing protein [Porticoccus sp.]
MNFIKTTIIGGLIFLVPVAIVAVVIGKAYSVMLVVAEPLDELIPIEQVGGIAFVNVLALLSIILLCFIAGIIAKSALAKKAYRSLDDFLMIVPGYALVKGITNSFSSGEEAAKTLIPSLVKFDECTQICFEVERSPEGNVVIFLPGAPDPWSGGVMTVSSKRVERLDMSLTEASRMIQQLGRGTSIFPINE